jgi:hypothetical protein
MWMELQTGKNAAPNTKICQLSFLNIGRKIMTNSTLANTETTGKNSDVAAFIGRVTLVHFLSYSLVGALFFALGLNVIVFMRATQIPLCGGTRSSFAPRTRSW